jgi:hypothetical protein
VREGVLLESGASRPEKCHWFLFTDYLLYTERVRDDQYRIKSILSVQGLRINDVPDKDELQNRFTISNAELLYAVTAETPELKRAWMDDLRRTGADSACGCVMRTDRARARQPEAPPRRQRRLLLPHRP